MRWLPRCRTLHAFFDADDDDRLDAKQHRGGKEEAGRVEHRLQGHDIDHGEFEGEAEIGKPAQAAALPSRQHDGGDDAGQRDDRGNGEAAVVGAFVGQFELDDGEPG